MIRKPLVKSISFEHNPTVGEFIQDDSLVRILIGPIGSGKTTGTAAECMRLSMTQEPNADNIRPVKGLVIRNTYSELKSTTIKTWLSMFPEEKCGHFKHQPPFEHHIKVPRGSGGTPGMDLLVDFLALDRPKDVRKLLSGEWSWIWFNELREIERTVFNQAIGRLRYPSPEMGGVYLTRKALVGDTNSFDGDHWLNTLRLERPQGFGFHVQPPSVYTVAEARAIDANVDYDRQMTSAGKKWVVNLDAENLPNLNDVKKVPLGTYYFDQVPGKPLDWIESYLQVKFVFVSDGRPCVPAFNAELHTFDDLPFLEKVPIRAGLDAGGGTLEPAFIIGQRHPRGNFLIHDEITAKDMGIKNFIQEINQRLAGSFDGRKVARGWGDPAGNNRDEIFQVAILQHFRNAGIPMIAAPSNDPAMRIQAWTGTCERMIDGKPALMVHKRCKKLIKGLSGKWFYKRKQVSGTEQFHLTPEKNEYSHPCDAGGYWLLGDGEFQSIKGREDTQKRNQSFNAVVDFDVFG